MNLLRGWDEVDENPMLLGLNDSVNHTEDLIKRLWSGKGDYDKIRRKLLASKEEREAQYLEELKELQKKKLTDK
ncbi:unnamed protein product [Heligmosomoides polygyrus]|uniref:Transposase n=1 Tax=Heligmosomoides polygyrus TaxID=6339 RepID=A0A183FLG0_HELPZ|nr:unnamed protein product [Heligmosomoides polygyrus]